jgi:hypothetical protein
MSAASVTALVSNYQKAIGVKSADAATPPVRN